VDLLTPHLILKLALTNPAIILECEQDIKPRELLQLFVILPVVRLQHERMGAAPAREDINAKLFKKRHELRYGTVPRRPVFLLEKKSN
jgi:hypothetical protein